MTSFARKYTPRGEGHPDRDGGDAVRRRVGRLATYTVTCLGGTNTMQAGLEAGWWPAPPGAAPTPIEATQGVFDDFITTPTTSGNVHPIRE